MTHEQAAKTVAEWYQPNNQYIADWFLSGRDSEQITRMVERKLAEDQADVTIYVTHLRQIVAGVAIRPLFSALHRREIVNALMTATDEQRIQAAAMTIEAMGGGEQ